MQEKSDIVKNTAIGFLFAYILLFLLMECVLNLTPPITRDALIHHLAIPKLWTINKGFFETPWADFSYYPMYVNMLYLIPLYFGKDILPKFIHWGFGLGTGIITYYFLKQRYDRFWGLLGSAVFISTPIVVWLSTSAYIDLGMTFFTTAGVVMLIKWRDSNYENLNGLILSGCFMGLAVGSKYNALIAWFLLNLLVVFIFVRDTRKQTAALKYGLIFFFLTALVASPWYIKNYVLTGDPFYPLFKDFFYSLCHQDSVREIVKQQIEKSTEGSIGFFQLREYMYGENFFETLFIPIRMFFQGRDNSYQYFQGRLNPILIIFLPFIFLKKELVHEKLLFLVFSVCFIIMAFFLTAKQVRYVLPTIPILTILAVMGVKNISLWLNERSSLIRRIAVYGLWLSIILLLVPNVYYLKDHFNKIDPIPYIMQKESKEDFLKRHLLHFEAVQFINSRLPEDSVVYTIYLGRRGYYLERKYKNDPSFGVSVIRRLVKNAGSEEAFIREVDSLNVTHIFMRIDLADRYLRLNYSDEEISRFRDKVGKYWKLLYYKNGHAVWQVHQ